MKPTSKIIQVSSTDKYFVFLCEDGEVWQYFPEDEAWQCVLSRAVQLQQQALNNN
jgi:hypothetical protein